jgi:hypothetical protein
VKEEQGRRGARRRHAHEAQRHGTGPGLHHRHGHGPAKMQPEGEVYNIEQREKEERERQQQEEEQHQQQQAMQQQAMQPYGTPMWDPSFMDVALDEGASFDSFSEPPIDEGVEIHEGRAEDAEDAAEMSGTEAYLRSGIAHPLGQFPAVTTEELEYIKRAFARGRGGFHIGPRNLGQNGEPLVNLELPEWMARVWTITFEGWSYEGDVGGAAVSPAGYKPDSGNPQSPQYLETNLDTTIKLKVRLEWGVSGSRTFAIIDYQQPGFSIALQASSLRVSCPLPDVFIRSGGPLPGIGAFASPFQRQSVLDPSLGPTFTYGAVIIGFGTVANFAAPPRAVAYRLIKGQSFIGSQSVALVQVRGQAATPVQFDEGTLVAADYEKQNSTLWQRLHPFAEGVQIQNNNGAGNLTLGIQYLIDLG